MKPEKESVIGKIIGICGQPFVAVSCGLLVGAIVILLSGQNVLEAYAAMIRGAFGSPFYLSSTLTRATPIIFGGLAIAVAWKSGYEVMGGEGQMIFGAFLSAVVAVAMPGPGIVKILAAILAAVLVGGIYSVFSGWLYDAFAVPFVISTLMLNYIANYLAGYWTSYTFRDVTAADNTAIQTQKIGESARLIKLFPDLSINIGFVFALLAAVAVLFLFQKTVFGYQARMNGLNPKFAWYGGIDSKKMLYLVLFLSGVLAAFGGAMEVLGTKFRYTDNMIFSTGYAWTGMSAALLAEFHPIGVVVGSIFLAALSTGGTAMQRATGIPVEAANMIEGVITLFMSAKLFYMMHQRYVDRKRRKAS